MDLITIMEIFPDQAACIEYLPRLRWQGSPECPYCESIHVNKRNETDIGRIGRWNCHDCHATFKVTCGTLFHGTKIALQKWFMAIALMTNAKKSLSSCQLARDLGLKQKAAWRPMNRIRAEMGKDSVLGQGIVEAIEKTMTKKKVNPVRVGVALRRTLLLVLLRAVGKSSQNLFRIFLVRQSLTSLRGLSIPKMLNSIPTSLKGTTASVKRWNMKQSIGVNPGKLMGYGPIRWKVSGLMSNGLGMDSITTIPQDIRPYILQKHAINTTTEGRTSLPSFSQRVWRPGKLKKSQVQNDLFRKIILPYCPNFGSYKSK